MVARRDVLAGERCACDPASDGAERGVRAAIVAPPDGVADYSAADRAENSACRGGLIVRAFTTLIGRLGGGVRANGDCGNHAA